MEFLLPIILLLTPLYVVKFSLLGLPTDALMVGCFVLSLPLILWLIIKKLFPVLARPSQNRELIILVSTAVFFLSGLLSLFINGLDRPKLGQFIVLFFEPVLIFILGRAYFFKRPNSKNIFINTCYVLLGIAGFYGLLQYFTLLGLPPAWWGNTNEPKRALSFFIHPNFYALWSAPLLALLIPDVTKNVKKAKAVAWIIGAAGLFLSLSRAGWMGLGFSILIYLIAAADKKIKKLVFITFIFCAIIVFATPNLRYRIILPFYGEKSAVSRFSLWQTGIEGIKKSPVLGLGLNGFSRNWQTLNTDKNLSEAHNFPHNIFLDLWVETGILGLISFLILVFTFIYNGLKNRRDFFALGVSLFLICLLIQGQIDNPYFKNDLAMVFWLVLTLV